MPTIEKMTGTATPTGRAVLVSPQAVKLFARAGIRPPDEAGQFLSVTDVDEKLHAAGFESHERIMAKRLLVHYGLLRPGQVPNLSRR